MEKNSIGSCGKYLRLFVLQFFLVFIIKSELWRHSKTCSLKENYKYCSIKKSKLRLYSNKYSTGASNELKNMIIDNMLQDEFGKLLFEDRLITTYGSFNLVSGGLGKIKYNIEKDAAISKAG